MATVIRKKGRMEQFIAAVVDGVVVPLVNLVVTGGVAFVVFTVLWLAFGAALVWSQGSLDAAWQWIRALPLVPQALVWLLFLPVVIGLWVWESTWPLVVRLVLVIGLAGWNIWIFLPKALFGRQ